MVIQFGTAHALANCHKYINNSIHEALDDFAMSYFNNIGTDSNSEEECVQYVHWVMRQMSEAGIYLKPKKCEFHKQIGKYLTLMISTKGIAMEEDKVETIQNWSPDRKMVNGRLNNLFNVQQLLSFCNYYRQCIHKYAKKAEDLMRLTYCDKQFRTESDEHLAFEIMVTAFTTAPILRHFDHHREVVIKADT